MVLNQSIFKANDIRGRYPEEINEKTAAAIGQALAKHWGKGLPAARRVVVAHDARISSPALYAAITIQLKTYNLEPITVGLATTPMFYFLVNKLQAVGGVMITASHNPKDYNGLKIVGPKAEVMSGKEVEALFQK